MHLYHRSARSGLYDSWKDCRYGLGSDLFLTGGCTGMICTIVGNFPLVMLEMKDFLTQDLIFVGSTSRKSAYHFVLFTVPVLSCPFKQT